MRDCRARWADQLVQQFCDEYSERYLLAFVYGYLATTTREGLIKSTFLA
jgi:hypothetical protein